MITIEKSRSGEDTAKIDNINLHSSYSPAKEAEKIFEANKLGEYSTFLLVEPCLNYLGRLNKKPENIIQK